jgi:hypothetical protein
MPQKKKQHKVTVTDTKLPPTAGDQPTANEATAAPTAGDQPTANEATAAPTAGDQPTANEATAAPTAGDQPTANEATAAPTAGDQPTADEATAAPTAGEEPAAGNPSPDGLLPLRLLLKNKKKTLLTPNDVDTLMNTIGEWMVTPDAVRIIRLLGATVVETDGALGRANKQFAGLHSGASAFMKVGEALKNENSQLTRTVSAFRIKCSELLEEVAKHRQDKWDHLVAAEEHAQLKVKLAHLGEVHARLKVKLAHLEKQHAQLQKTLAHTQVTDDSHKSSATTPDAPASSATSTEPPVNGLQSSIQNIIQDKQRQATEEQSRLNERIKALTTQQALILQNLQKLTLVSSSASASDEHELMGTLTQVINDKEFARLQLAEVSTKVAAFTDVHIPSLLEACMNLIDAASTPAATPASTPAATPASTPAATPASTPAATAATPASTPATTAVSTTTPPRYKMALEKQPNKK